MKSGMSVLDVGCANGDLYLCLNSSYDALKYEGIDVSKEMIQRAQELAPGALFHHENFLSSNFNCVNEYDLVTATGVFQHESRYADLLKKMIDASKEYILFDVKLFRTHATICDLRKAYRSSENPMYFIVLNIKAFLDMVSSMSEVGHISMFGYYAGVNKAVLFLDEIDE